LYKIYIIYAIQFYRELYCEELAHPIMETGKLQELQSESANRKSEELMWSPV
jgi:hypothetical protein